VDGRAQRADRLAGFVSASEQGDHTGWCLARSVLVSAASAAGPGAHVLSQQLCGGGIEDAHVRGVPLHGELSADVTWRRRVVGTFDLDTAVQVNGALAELVVTEALGGEC
jgi:hypothetical protein